MKPYHLQQEKLAEDIYSLEVSVRLCSHMQIWSVAAAVASRGSEIGNSSKCSNG